MPEDKQPPISGRLAGAQRRFGHYNILEKLGEGGIGEIYKVIDTRSSDMLVLKLLRRDQAGSAMAESWFQAEIRGCSRIKHPNIIRALDSGKIDGKLYYVMRFIDGKTLKQLLNSGVEFDEDTALMSIETVARALGHVHRAGIVHCDIKPDNIMVNSARQPIVIDFGLSVDLHDMKSNGLRTSGSSGYLVGTPAYMAPEQIRGGSSEISPAVDVYALGAVLFELLCETPPFTEEPGAGMMSIVQKVLDEPPPRPSALNSSIRPEVEDIILKCLDKTPSHRYASADELAVTISKYRKGIRFRRPSKGLFRRISGFFVRQELKPKKNHGDKK